MQRLDSIHNDDSSNNGSNLGHSGISPKPIRSESPMLKYVDVKQHYTNTKNKPANEKISAQKFDQIESTASKYEIPTLDRTLSDENLGIKPG